MIDFEKHQITIVIVVLLVLIGLYFLHTWHVGYILDEKLKKLVTTKKERKEPFKHNLVEEHEPDIQQDNSPNQYEIDSYVEPNGN